MESVIKFANSFHHGSNVYPSKEVCLAVLRKAQSAHLPWWNTRCTAFVDALAACPAPIPKPSSSSFPVVLVEGLDGVGKTLITTTLASRLSGTVVATPLPEWNDIRPCYMEEPEAIARCFYAASNYLAAVPIAAHRASGVVVVDRWWSSTCAMALANQHTRDTLPLPGDAVYQWPRDLLRPEYGFYLHVEEPIRQARVKARAPEQAEEKRLAERKEMRATAEEAYRRLNVLEAVEAYTYRHAVNAIVKRLADKGALPKEKAETALFTKNELDEIKPF